MCEHCDNNGTDSICGVKITEYVRAARDGETLALKLCLELQAVVLFLLHEHNQTPDGWCDSWNRVCDSIWVKSGLNFDFPEPAATHLLDAFIETTGTLLFDAADRGAFVQVQNGPQVRYLWDNKIVARHFGSPDSVRDWIVSKTSPTTPKSILKRTSQDAPGSAHGGRHGHQLQQSLINRVGATEASHDLGIQDPKHLLASSTGNSFSHRDRAQTAPSTPAGHISASSPSIQRRNHRAAHSLSGGLSSSIYAPLPSFHLRHGSHSRSTSAAEDFLVGKQMLEEEIGREGRGFGTPSTSSASSFMADLPPWPGITPSASRMLKETRAASGGLEQSSSESRGSHTTFQAPPTSNSTHDAPSPSAGPSSPLVWRTQLSPGLMRQTPRSVDSGATHTLSSPAGQVIHEPSGAQSGEHHPLQAIPEVIKLQQHPPGAQPRNCSQSDQVPQISQPGPEHSFTAPSAPRSGSAAAFVQLPTQNAVTPGMAVSNSSSVAKLSRSAHIAPDATSSVSAHDMLYTRNKLDVVSNPNRPSRASTPTTVVCSQSTPHAKSQVTAKEEPTEQALNSAVGALRLDSAPALDLASTNFQEEQRVKQRPIMVPAPRALTTTPLEDMNVQVPIQRDDGALPKSGVQLSVELVTWLENYVPSSSTANEAQLLAWRDELCRANARVQHELDRWMRGGRNVLPHHTDG
ncbi:uncharacterized protein NECHADRAFT_88687 [Fusarium vanettenii 77-13-4]|uniref:Uncharacterized protein n=1 Tax=Fusarium vanettenii (strain ATCC MYA-4622 / CBS 123669 / FGSC 9596 / NRRL 45880 / 77-13-4) TaxID=660122 RepID=C7ZLI5_FUSV7|nr:uncharacterized protein NECHADRAFT_88687 [Fusarium vanettenii 77-13-4]EEU35142.1 hypothetical protein NECHADRAFT_88687 [Fusarium vanettenii 77-13-4]